MDLKIEKEESEKGGRFFAKLDETHTAEMTWVDVSDKLRICDHTGVPVPYEGQGIAGKLLNALVEDARDTHVKYIPLCPYVAVQFKRHPEWSDVFVVE